MEFAFNILAILGVIIDRHKCDHGFVSWIAHVPSRPLAAHAAEMAPSSFGNYCLSSIGIMLPIVGARGRGFDPSFCAVGVSGLWSLGKPQRLLDQSLVINSLVTIPTT